MRNHVEGHFDDLGLSIINPSHAALIEPDQQRHDAQEQLLLPGLALGLCASIGAAPQRSMAQASVSTDPEVRATQQWEELLLLQDFAGGMPPHRPTLVTKVEAVCGCRTSRN